MSEHAHHIKPQAHVLLSISVLIILAAFIIRIVKVDEFPLYLDEATHIMRAELAHHEGDWFNSIIDNKALYPIVLALFKPSGPEGPFLARMVSVLSGMLAMAGTIWLGRRAGGTKTAITAALLYAVLPMAVFHERLALVDPLKAAFTTLSIVFSVWLVEKPRPLTVLFLSLSLAAAYLTKITGLIFFAMPIVALVVFMRSWRHAGVSAIWVGASLLMAWGVSRWVFNMAEKAGDIPVQYNLAGSRFRIFDLANPGVQEAIIRDFHNFVDFTSAYVGWIMVALAFLSVPFLIWGNRRREILYLWVPAGVFTFGHFLIRSDLWTLPARYMMSSTAPFVALTALVITLIAARLGTRIAKASEWVTGILLLLIVIPSFVFFSRLMHGFDAAPLASGDNYLYVRGWTNGYAFKEAGVTLVDMWETGDGRPLNTMGYGEYYWQTTVHVGSRLGEHTWLKVDRYEPQMAEWLARDEQVYVIENRHRATPPMSENPLNAVLSYTGEYTYQSVDVHLWEVVGAKDTLADLVYEYRVPTIEKIADRYDWVAGEIAPVSFDREAVIIFPAAHESALTERGVRNVVSLHPTWPLDIDAATNAVADLQVKNDEFVEVIQVNPDSLNPGRSLSRALSQTWFLIGQYWYEQIHRSSFLTTSTEIPYQGFAGEWEDAVRLTEVAVVDPVVQPGEYARIAFKWSTNSEIPASYNVFVHVVDTAGNLITQYDSVPQGGAYPMNLWQPGEIIEDRFAVLLPPDTPAGVYIVRAGIYSPDGGYRLRVTGGSDAADYVEVGRVTVETNP